ncbi:MAG: hypothetical protein EBR10_05285 [Planctomycetes bacterium]|nr:hypothetical protein [Planctomycetota bacterium]
MIASLIALCMWLQGSDLAPPKRTLEEGAKSRYAEALLREAYLILNPSDISVSELEGAILLTRKAALLEPENAERWYLLLAQAGYAGDVLPAAIEATAEALMRLSKLRPADEQIRLRRLLLELDRRETAELRIAAFGKLLTPESVQVIGPAVASRLAYDLALLESRSDNVEGFASAMNLALSLSPSFPAAADTAAGFISERVENPIDECELLVNAAMANPAELRGWTRLAALLMQEGAYGSAARVIRLAIPCFPNREDQELGRNIAAADLALALWGSNRPADALQSLRQHESDSKQRQVTLIQTYNAELTRAECEAVPFPYSQLIATVSAAIEVDMKSPTAGEALARLAKVAKESAEQESPLNPAEPPKSPEETERRAEASRSAAAQLLDAAVSAALLGAEGALVEDLLAVSGQRAPLPDGVRQRFDAWKRLQSGDGAGALTLLGEGTRDQPPTHFLRAACFEATGDRKGAARAFLDIAQDMRGTMIGILAASRLKSVLGSPLPDKPEVKQLDGIVASIPAKMERYLNGLDVPVRFEARPLASAVEPFDPIRIDFVMTNQTTLTLAVTPTGPIESLVLVQPRLSSTTQDAVSRLQPQIVPFDRAVQLAPGESMSMRWDFGWSECGLRISQQPLEGGLIDARIASNFNIIAGAYSAGPFGVMPTMRSILVQGVRMNDAWWESALRAASELKTDADLVQVALLAFAADNKLVSAERKAAAAEAVTAAFPKLPPMAQSWLLLVGPRVSAAFGPVLDLARATADPDVRVAYLLAHCTTKDDPQVAAAERSGSAEGQLIAQVMRARFERELVRADERMRGQKSNARTNATERLKNMKKLRIEEVEAGTDGAQGGDAQPGPSGGQAATP